MSNHFKSITLFGCPPIGHNHFTFSSGVNFLIGGNGAGKTSIAHALRTVEWPYGGGVQLEDPSVSQLLNERWSLSYVDGSNGYFSGDCPTDHWSKICVGVPRLQKKLSALLSTMMSGKLGVDVTKFHSVPYVGDETFDVEVFSNGGVEVHAGAALKAVEHYSPYGSIEELFDASGERCVINLAGILVAREELNLDSPFVLDGVFNDAAEFRPCIFQQLRKLECQRIILENYMTMDRLHGLGLTLPNDTFQSID